ncbi:MFS transporter [Propionibacterium cyclohexanicum]|nr:MFS transporter [Propionibacterium cyclohexanicum]
MSLSYLERYRLAYYLRSTALTLPVLALWWTDHAGVSVSMYLTGMALSGIVSMVLDVPLSLWSDRSSPRYPYTLGLAVFAAGFLATALVHGPLGFGLYLFSISAASALMSGSDNTMLMDLVGPDELKGALFELNRNFYAFTAVLFVVGVGAYKLFPPLVFVLQFASIAAAALLVWTIRPDHETADRMADSGHSPGHGWSVVRAALTGRVIVVILSICLGLGALDGANQLQNRTIQLRLSEVTFFGVDHLWVIAAVMVVTNLVSSLGLGRRVHNRTEDWGAMRTMGALFGVAAVSLVLLAVPSVLLILLGAILFAVTKGVYRPFFASLIARTVPNPQWRARWFSICGVGANIVSSGLNAGIGLVIVNAAQAQLAWSLVCVLVGVPVILAISFSSPILMAERNGAMSHKRS